MSTKIESLELEIKSNSTDAASGIESLSKSLDKLKLATKGGLGLSSLTKEINSVGKAVNSIRSSSLSNLTGLAKAIDSLNKTKFSDNISNQIKSITNIDSGTLDAFKTKILEVTDAVRPLATEMEKVAVGFSALPTNIQKAITSTDKLAMSNSTASFSFTNLYHKMKSAWRGFSQGIKTIGSFITKSSDYIENLHLFDVAMREYAVEAKNYAEQVSEVLGIDPGEWMYNQGLFQTLITGFGVAGDSASKMSKNLTQLAYDLSSFYNIDVETAMQKLKSGMAGELEPLRAIGYDLSQAKLEATAAELGIDKAVSSMTQAEKAMLRYHAIMTQVGFTHGDMAETIREPANQLRILKAQLEMLGREIGNVIMPVLRELLPYAIAIVKVIREIMSAIGSLIGVEVADVGQAAMEMADGSENTASALENASDEAKKLRSYMLGIDELNVINPNNGDDTSTDAFDIDIPEYDFLEKASDGLVGKIVERMKEWLGITEDIKSWSDLLDTKFGDILKTIGLITTGLLAWAIAPAITKTIDKLSKLKDINWSFKLTGATLLMGDLDKLKQYFDDFVENGATFSNVTGMLSEFSGALGDVMIALGKVEIGGALKVVQGLGEIVSAINDIAENGADFTNITDLIRGLSNVAIGIGFLTGNTKLAGAGMIIQGLTTIIQELAENWEAIKQGDWSGVDKATLVIGAITVIAGIVTALDVFSTLKQGSKIGDAAKDLGDVTTATESVNTATSTMTTKLKDLAKNLGLGLVILVEVAAAAILIVGAIWVLGKELEQVGIAWQPVIENGDTVLIAMGLGTGLLVGIGVAVGLLGKLGKPIAKQMGDGLLILLEVGAAAILFTAEILVIGKLLDEVGKAWEPVMENGGKIAEAIGIGTGILILIGGLCALLGVAATATAGALPLAIGLGTLMLLEVGIATNLFIDEIIVIGGLLDEVGIAWKPVLQNGETIAEGIRKGTELLIGIGIVAAALGVASVATVGLLPLAIALGTKMLEQLTDSFIKFTTNIVKVADQLRLELHPALDKVSDILPDVTTNMNTFTTYMSSFAGAVVKYSKNTAVAGIASTISNVIGFFAGDPVSKMTSEVRSQNNQFDDLIDELEEAIPKIREAIDLQSEYQRLMSEYGQGSGGGVLSKIGDFFGGIGDAIGSLFSRSANTSTTVSVGTIPTYANGGYPESGQAFIARENGIPEMVGTIGRRTAVANNEQIVESVASGVAEANSEQNMLLREQNTLLRQLLEKDSGVYLDGRSLSASVDKYKREQGRVLITGGAL